MKRVFSLFFRGICNEKLAKLLIRKCCLFIWYQNRPFKIKFEVISLRVVQFNSHLQKTKINHITQSWNFKAAPLAFWLISNCNLYWQPCIKQISTGKSATPSPPPLPLNLSFFFRPTFHLQSYSDKLSILDLINCFTLFSENN